MSLPKLLGIFSIILFMVVGSAILFKGSSDKSVRETESVAEEPYEVALDQELQSVEPAARTPEEKKNTQGSSSEQVSLPTPPVDLPEADRIDELFSKDNSELPIVETITYKSRVAWQKGRPAWLSDYAVHYSTSRHFIARSLNGKPDYLKQNIAEGDRFNVFKKDKKIEFYLVVDLSRCKMWLYCIDKDVLQTTLLKTYQVGLGRLDPSKASGLLTPLGTYTLGNKTAVYQPKAMGYHNGKKVEMLSVFGTRWIPFDKEVASTTVPAKGFGIHGTPWNPNAKGVLEDDRSSIGKYKSDGCIRMTTPDVEELFAIITTRPTTIALVRDFAEAKIP